MLLSPITMLIYIFLMNKNLFFSSNFELIDLNFHIYQQVVIIH